MSAPTLNSGNFPSTAAAPVLPLPSANTITFVVGDYGKIKEAAMQDPVLPAKLEAIKGKAGKEASYVV